MDESKDGPVAVAEPEDDQAVKITELVEFVPTRVDGVATPANGFPVLIMKSVAETSVEPAEVTEPDWLPAAKALAAAAIADPTADPGDLMKAVNAAGEVDEGPDIAGGKQAIQLIARLIAYEAQELEAGCFDEAYDIALLLEAVSAVRCFLMREQGGDMDAAMDGDGAMKAAAEDDGWLYPADEVAKDSRTFTAAERKKHAAEGNALPDGSYPIPDKDALRRAAILARSGHGDVTAAKRLIARRARELGVPNPLDDDGDEKGAKSVDTETVVAEDATDGQTEHQDDGLSKAVEAAVTKALEGPKAEIATLRAELAKVADLPRPGGPVMAIARPSKGGSDATDWLTKASDAQRLADTVTSTEDAEAYRQLASQYRAKAAAALS